MHRKANTLTVVIDMIMIHDDGKDVVSREWY